MTFEQQLAQLKSRGMLCTDPQSAVTVLARLGYYRFSAYAYPFRNRLDVSTPRETRVQHREDDFAPNTRFEIVEELASFDRGLRMLCLDALEAVELALRVQVAYVLGARSTFGYLDALALDAEKCGTANQNGSGTTYDDWLTRYQRLQDDAQAEDFVMHYVEKYDGVLPVWVAIEVMDFGSLVRLFGFLKRADQNAIARSLGVPDGKLFARVLKTLNYLRNISAHHARLWNRTLTYQLPKFPETFIPALGHLATLDEAKRKKIYGSLAFINHLVSLANPDLKWAARTRAHLLTFPKQTRVSLANDMGFPSGWDEQLLWKATKK